MPYDREIHYTSRHLEQTIGMNCLEEVHRWLVPPLDFTIKEAGDGEAFETTQQMSSILDTSMSGRLFAGYAMLRPSRSSI